MGGVVHSTARLLGGLALSLAAAGLLWVGLLKVFDVSSYVGKGP